MRTKAIVKQTKLKKEVHSRCVQDRNYYQKNIGGGKWSISDTIEKYQKIIDDLKCQ